MIIESEVDISSFIILLNITEADSVSAVVAESEIVLVLKSEDTSSINTESVIVREKNDSVEVESPTDDESDIILPNVLSGVESEVEAESAIVL